MNCSDFESLLAEALGHELDPADQAAIEVHLSECGRCRQEYDASCAALDRVRDLPAPPRVSIYREGPRLVIGPAHSPAKRARRTTAALLRYAAVILLAFAAGYAYRSPARPQAPTTPAHHAANDGPHPDGPRRPTLRTALAAAHSSGPNRSDLAKCMSSLLTSSTP